MKSQEIRQLIHDNQRQKLTEDFSPREIVNNFSFKETMQIVSALARNTRRMYKFLNYAIDIMLVLRKVHPQEWNNDWKNGVLFYDYCSLTLRHEEGYDIFIEAFHHCPSPPPQLLLYYTFLYDSPPGIPRISWEEAERTLRQILAIERTYEPALQLANLYKERKMKKEASYWLEQAGVAKKTGRFSTPITKKIPQDV